MAEAIDQETYDRIFDAAFGLAIAAEANPADVISGPLAATLFALLNAYEREPVYSDQFALVIAEAEKLAVAYETFRMEVLAQ